MGLAMDATAVLFCLSVCNPGVKKTSVLKAATYFAFFQGAMPLLGYVAGLSTKGFIESYDHWIAFILLILVGGKMIYEANEAIKDKLFSNRNLLIMGIATSIDALVVGVTFSFININLWLAAITITVVTLIFSFTAGLIAKRLSHFKPSILRIAGGAAIILIGVRILLEHLF